jgi:hypothetical protein
VQSQAVTVDAPFKNFISGHPSNAEKMDKLEAPGKDLKPVGVELFTNIDGASVKQG